MNILIADDISEIGLAKLQALPGADVRIRTGLSEAQLISEVADVEAILVRSATRITAPVLEAAKQLKVVGRAGVGVDNIDIPAATKHGVIVINAPDGNTISAAEHTFAMLMSAARLIPSAHGKLHEGKWDRKSFVGVELRGKTLSVLGMGRIGTEVAKRALAFEMTVVGYDPFLTDERAKELGITRATLEDAIAAGDFITVHTPLTKETRHMINKEAFLRMKDGVRVINCARGGIIDEEALVEALRSGKVAGAALDVFEKEPLAADHPLLSMQNVVVTPHLGASTIEAQVNVAIDVAEEVSKVLLGKSFRNAVNLPAMSSEQREYLEPYLQLGEKLGLFAAQWLAGDMSDIEISYGGNLAHSDVSFITRTVLKGLLGYQYGDEVNYVNAPLLADQGGISVRELKDPRSKVFTNLVVLSIKSGQETHRVAGTLYNGFGVRIVEVDGFAVDASPEGKVLLLRHTDKPGIIGQIGTMLGDAEVNIATMQVGRKETGGEAIMFLGVDKLVPDEVVAKIEKIADIHQVRSIEL